MQPLDDETTEQYDAFLTYIRLLIYERKSTTGAMQEIAVGCSKAERTLWNWKVEFQWDRRINAHRYRLAEKALAPRLEKELRSLDKFLSNLTPENAAEMMKTSNDFTLAIIGRNDNLP